MIKEKENLAGRGMYSIPDASRIIRADPRNIRRWASGAESHSKTRIAPALTSEILTIKGTEYLSFPQMIELLFIRLFRQHKISLPVIRAAAQNAARFFGAENPFAVAGLQTDGKSIFHLDPDEIEANGKEKATQKQIVLDLAKAQIVIGEFAKPYFEKINYHGLYASEYWPLGKERHIVIAPDRAFGSPIDAESGVPTNILNGMYESGDSIELISQFYNVEKSAVIDAIEFEHYLLDRAA